MSPQDPARVGVFATAQQRRFRNEQIATYGDRGLNIRKLIDYFCHLSIAPDVYDDIKENDADFARSP